MRARRCSAWLLLLMLAGCATTPPPAASRMAPAKLDAQLRIPVYVEEVRLGSAAEKREAPFEMLAGKFPLTEPEGLDELRGAIRMTLAAAGATLEPQAAAAKYILTPTVLGALTIPFPEAHAILFVRYELSAPGSAAALWSQNVYSHAKFESRSIAADAEAAYSRLAAANLRQMVGSLSQWAATGVK